MALGLRLELTKVKLWQHILSGFVRKENPIEFEQTHLWPLVTSITLESRVHFPPLSHLLIIILSQINPNFINSQPQTHPVGTKFRSNKIAWDMFFLQKQTSKFATMLVQDSAQSLTGVECRANSVAKKQKQFKLCGCLFVCWCQLFSNLMI